MSFKLWSETSEEISRELRPDFGFRSWDSLSSDDRYKIWKFLEQNFFSTDLKHDYDNAGSDGSGKYYPFFGNYEEQLGKQKRIYRSIWGLNDLYKAKSYARNFLENETLFTACLDFYTIVTKQTENVVMELLSLYSRAVIIERKDLYFPKDPGQSENDYKIRKEEWCWQPFDLFSAEVNEVFSHFGLNVYLTRLGFVPRQEEKILKEVFDPVIRTLAPPQWKEVNQLLTDAFKEYRVNTPNGFSNCVTNTVSAVQAFLQILVNGKTGTGDISKLITQAQSKSLIPNDLLSKEIFKNIESILMKERQETGISHPKKEYATEKNARMVLNIAMVFFQHCIQN